MSDCLDDQVTGMPLIISRVPDQKGISQACYIVEIYHSGLELSIFLLVSFHSLHSGNAVA